MTAALMQLVRQRTSDEHAALRNIVRTVLDALERARLQPYSPVYRSNKADAIRFRAAELIDAEAERALGTLTDCPMPPEPPEALERYWQACAWHQQQIDRMRIEPDSRGPMKPAEVKAYEDDCQRASVLLRESARIADVYWFRPSFLDQVRRSLTDEFTQKVHRPPSARKDTPRSSQVLRHNPLIGSTVRYFDDATSQGLLTKDEMQRHVPLPLVFLDDLKRGGRSRAEEERRSESSKHNTAVDTMVGLLRRVGYQVYPGGVGLAGVYAMADLLAVRDDGFLFVECLTKSAVARGHHLKKRDLAERVPFCFVGPLPSEFMGALPQSVYGIDHCHAARMLDGTWVPRFYRQSTAFEPRFRAQVVRGRKLTRIGIRLDGLRLQEDVSSFLWGALSPPLFKLLTASKGMQDLGWKIGLPREGIGHVPFTRHGQAESAFRMEGQGSRLIIRLGSVPVRAELEGSMAAFEQVQSWLEQMAFPIDVM